MTTKTILTIVIFSVGDYVGLAKTLRSISAQSGNFFKLHVLVVSCVRDGNEEASYHVAEENPGREAALAVLQAERVDFRYRSELELIDIRGTYFTFVYEGDSLSRSFIASLLNSADANVIPTTQILCLGGKTGQPFQESTRALAETGSPHLAAHESVSLLTEPVGKLLSRGWLTAQRLQYAIDFEWHLFFVSLVLDYSVVLSRFPAAVGAIYYRRDTSAHSTRDSTRNDPITYAWNALEDLQALKKHASQDLHHPLFKSMDSHLMNIIQRSWQSHSGLNLFEALADSGLRSLPWEILDVPVDTLAIVANFSPYAGTAGIVAGKRLIEGSRRVDVISSFIKSRERRDEDVILTEPYVREHIVLYPGLRGDSDVNLKGFIASGVRAFQNLSGGTDYKNLYSRSMMPHSHILAMAIKKQKPELNWTAEFSDPNSIDVVGQQRLVKFEEREFIDYFSGLGSGEQQRLLKEDPRLYRWSELLPYFFADTLIFTNANQLEVMLEHAPTEYRESIRGKAIISPHPTLPRAYYEMSEPAVEPNPKQIRLAYFGNFYTTRGLQEVIDALSRLSDKELELFSLLIFTGSRHERIHPHIPGRLSRVLDIRPRLDFLSFLSTLDQVDCLIVNDASSSNSFPRNPYLPSKVSDYRGSQTPIWAIFEPESTMSAMTFDYKSRLGDDAGALAVLRQLLSKHSMTV